MLSMDLDDLDDAELLLALRSQPEAFAALYRRYERPVLAWLVRRTGRADLAADLTAETFAGALESLRRDTGPSGPFAPWIFTIARNKLADTQRRGHAEDSARRRLEMDPVLLGPVELSAIDRLADDAVVLDLVSALPADQREAVVARIIDEKDYAEIAAELRCSELVVRKRVSRGLAGLRLRLEGNAS
ncbi:MAG: sigma-70 family RNA polymerase sigma factor [Solirubrobacteraceae bacterium]|nr:sigma-70 family RNA polymerase sigma factor [Solirubrobacteraceae bacterium]